MSKYIWRRGKRYYLYGNFDTWEEAYKVARYYKNKVKGNQYFIEKVETFFLAQHKYKLYMTKVFSLGLFG